MNIHPKLYIKDFIKEVTDFLDYKVLNKPFEDESMLPTSLDLHIEYSKEEGSFFAEIRNHVGIYTASDTIEGTLKNIDEQIYEFYGFPRVQYRNFEKRWHLSDETIEKLQKDGATVKIKIPSRKFAGG